MAFVIVGCAVHATAEMYSIVLLEQVMNASYGGITIAPGNTTKITLPNSIGAVATKVK